MRPDSTSALRSVAFKTQYLLERDPSSVEFLISHSLDTADVEKRCIMVMHGRRSSLDTLSRRALKTDIIEGFAFHYYGVPFESSIILPPQIAEERPLAHHTKASRPPHLMVSEAQNAQKDKETPNIPHRRFPVFQSHTHCYYKRIVPSQSMSRSAATCRRYFADKNSHNIRMGNNGPRVGILVDLQLPQGLEI